MFVLPFMVIKEIKFVQLFTEVTILLHIYLYKELYTKGAYNERGIYKKSLFEN